MSSQPVRPPMLLVLYRKYLEDQNSTSFVRRLSSHYAPGTLERLAVHPSPEVRRGAVMALGLVGDYQVNGTMGRALQDDDRTVRLLAEDGIRHVWARAGDSKDQQQLQVIIRLNLAGRFTDAVRRCSQLVERAPWFAEAWSQRAVARFALLEFAESIRDAHQTLELNPYHFAAAAGMGQAYLRLGNRELALECFRRALKLCPDLEGIRVEVARLVRPTGE